MRDYDLKKLLSNREIVDGKIKQFIADGILRKEKVSVEEMTGHLLKAEHNLNFVRDTLKAGYLDWAITGCYYACYQAVLALILTKGYSSKNHFATLCVLIKEFYGEGLNKEDIELISKFLDYQDVLFYVESKDKRERATYSTRTLYDKKEVENLRIKAVLFVNKLKDIIK